MSTLRRCAGCLLLLVVCCGEVIMAQTPAITGMDAVVLGKNKFLDVFFSKPLDAAHPEDLATANVTVVALPGSTPLKVSEIRRLGGDPTEIEIALTGDPLPSDVQIMLTINRRLNFMDGQKAISAPGPFTFTATLIQDAKTLDAAMKALVDTMTKAGKSSQEKNIFASGFVTTASSGTQGGADIHLNSDLGVPGLKAFLNIVKTTADGSDAKNFEAGGTFRSTFLLGKGGRAAIQTALNAYRNAPTEAARRVAASQYDAAVRDFQKMILAAIFLDFTGKLEGEATNFNVTNGVFEASLKIQSRVKNLFGTRQGFFHFQMLPAGFEGGKTLRQSDAGTTETSTGPADTALRQLDGIARFKAGGTLNLFWENSKPSSPLKRFELESGIVERYLFLNEIHYDATKKTNSTILKGSKPYFYSDAKLFLVETTAGRYGVKISYNRGSLPPVYADVKSFQFGFLFESAN